MLALQSGSLYGQGGFVGSARCTVCHTTQAGVITQKPHRESACESCHGPGLAHVEALDSDKLAIYAGSQSDTVNRACLSCHKSDAIQARRFESPHSRNGVAGTAYGKKGNAYTTKGATGVPTRLLVEFLIGRTR